MRIWYWNNCLILKNVENLCNFDNFYKILVFQQLISSPLANVKFQQTIYNKEQYIGHSRWYYLTVLYRCDLWLCQQVCILNVSKIKACNFPFCRWSWKMHEIPQISRVHYVYPTNWAKYDSRCKQISKFDVLSNKLDFCDWKQTYWHPRAFKGHNTALKSHHIPTI